MRNLFRFITRHHFVFLFVLIQLISLTLLFQHNNYHRTVIANTTRSIKGVLNTRIYTLREYLSLRETNKELLEENTRLRNQLIDSYKTTEVPVEKEFDSAYNKQYEYIPAKVVNNSTNKQHNFITINKGRIHGIEKEMGVVSSNGVVGIITGISQNFSTIIPVLNINLRLSAKIEESGYFGSLFWEGKDSRRVSLIDIPHHAEVSRDNQVVTSGYSAIFPAGIKIGTIEDYKITGGNFYKATVELSTNFQNLSYVYVIRNHFQQEQIELENTERYD